MQIILLTTTIIALLLIKSIFNWLRTIYHRTKLYVNLGKLCRKNTYEMQNVRLPIATLFTYSSKPDIIIKTDDTEYIIRLITCRARKRIYHFANHEFFARAMRVTFMQRFATNPTTYTLFKHFKHLPPLDEKYLTDGDLKKQVVLLFNPSPLEISYTSKGSKKEIGGNGSNFDGWMIYNAKGFIKLLTPIERST